VALVAGIVATFSPAAVVVVVALVLGCLLLLGVLLFVLPILRAGARLEGTRLVVATRFGGRRCDLARADVSLDEISVRQVGEGSVRVPLLVACDPGGERRVWLRLRSPRGHLLPAEQLEALAAAIESGTRKEPSATRSREVAKELRQLGVRL
jgi:hypothetical protein